MRKAFAHTAAYDARHRRASSPSRRRRAVPRGAVAAVPRRRRTCATARTRTSGGAFYRDAPRAARADRSPSPRCSRARSSRTTTSSTSTRRSAWCSSSPSSPAAVIIKHNTPCGVAAGRRAGEGLPHGARGRRGVRLRRHRGAQPRGGRGDRHRRSPRPSSRRSSRPSYSAAALQVLAAKKNLRLLEAGPALAPARSGRAPQLELRSISGGLLLQDRDARRAGRRVEGRHQARAHRRGADGAPLRLAGVQAREEQRHRLRHRRTGCSPRAAGRPAGWTR